MGTAAARAVLIVEDDPSIRELLHDILAGEGFRVTACRDIASAVAHLAEAGPPDVALIDLHLPDGMGTDLCRTLRARSVPCLILSAFPRARGLAAAEEAQAWIQKPFDLPYLLASVQDLLPAPLAR